MVLIVLIPFGFQIFLYYQPTLGVDTRRERERERERGELNIKIPNTILASNHSNYMNHASPPSPP